MEKLLRILFVMCAIAFVTTATACADDKDDKTGGDDKTTKTGGNDKTAKTGGNDKPAKTGGNDKPAKTPSILKFTAADAGVTIDESKDVYKITINPSLLNYANVDGVEIAALAPAPIFTVTFTDDNLQGFIIPTTADKADALSTTHVADLTAAITAGFNQGALNNVTHSFLAAVKPGFDATEINTDWSTLAPRIAILNGADTFDGVADIMTDTKVRVSCKTTITGPKAASFTVIAPADADDLAIAKGTETVCAFSLVKKIGITDEEETAAYKTWATDAVALKAKNIQKMGFVGIVTGDDTASAITKAAGITVDGETLGVKGFTAETSAKLVKAYTTSLQKVEIVIAVAK